MNCFFRQVFVVDRSVLSEIQMSYSISVGVGVFDVLETTATLSFPYASRLDVETVFGTENVKRWADINNNENPAEIDARIQWAILLAEDYVNNRLRGGPYAVPFAFPFPRVITDAAARIAGVRLYDSRGITDSESPNHSLKVHEKHAERVLNDILAVRIRLDRDLVTGVKTYPTATDFTDL